MLVLNEIPIGHVHMDCDIVIRKPEHIMERLESDYDGISYCIEKPVYDHIGIYASEHFSINQFINTQYPLDESSIFNAGFIGWKNEEFKNEFLSQYFVNANKINEKYDEITRLYESIENIISKGIVVRPVYDFIIEQMNFTRIAKNNHYMVSTILDSCAFHCSLLDQLKENNLNNLWSDENNLNKSYFESQDKLGVTHYFGDFKNIWNINRLYNELKSLDNPFYYSLFISNIQQNKELYNLLLNTILDEDLIEISYSKSKPISPIAIINKKYNPTNVELNSILKYYKSEDLYIFSNELKHKFHIRVNTNTIVSTILTKVYEHFRPSYKWITFIDDNTILNLDLLNKIKDVEKYDLILYNNTPIINTRLKYEDLSKDLNKLNILRI